MHTLIYLTGPQCSGKTKFVNSLIKAVEITITGESNEELDTTREKVLKWAPSSNIVVVTQQTDTPKMFTDGFLMELAKEKNVYYHSINLKRQSL